MLIRRRFTVILLLAITTILAPSIPSHAVFRTVEGVVKKVADGDTLTIVTPVGTKSANNNYHGLRIINCVMGSLFLDDDRKVTKA